MSIIAIILISIVIAFHIGFMILEMYLWDRETGRKIFGLTKDFATQSRSLAMNQGLYNGFLAAGLTWGLISESAGAPVLIFFLFCIIVAGIFGAITVSKTILFVQTIPALLALLAVLYL